MDLQNTQEATTPAAPLLATRPTREIRVVESEIALFDTAKFEHLSRIATGMARASLIPDHLKSRDSFDETLGNCLMVVNQAHRWDVDPFALAACTYVVKGRLGFEGKAIQAVIESRLRRKLRFRYNTGQGETLAIVVYDAADGISPQAKELLIALAEKDDKSALSDLQDEHGIRAVRTSVKQARTDNKIWTTDPEQKLVYTGVIKWARRYEPGMIMGVRTEDDVDRELEQELNDIPKAVLPSQSEPPRQITDTTPEVVSAPVTRPRGRPRKAAEPTEAPAATAAEEKTGVRSQESVPEPNAGETSAPATTAAAEPDTAHEILQRALAAGFQGRHVVDLARRINYCETTAKTIGEIPAEKRALILDDWDEALEEMAKLKAKEGGIK